MTEPLVAVITRTRGRARYLARALRSVETQAFPDLVHVVVNDGGDPAEVDAAVAGLSTRVQVEHVPKSIGRGAAANLGLARSRSRLVVFHDDDDTWAPHFLERAVATWRASGRRGVVTAAECVIERDDGNDIVELRREPFFPSLRAVSLAEVARESCFVNLGFLFERAATLETGGYDESLPLYEDWDFSLRFLRLFDVAFINEPLARYHQREVATGAARSSFAQEGALAAADARAVMVNRWLRKGDHVGLLMALGPTLQSIESTQVRVDKLFNLAHGARQQWPLKLVEKWLRRP